MDKDEQTLVTTECEALQKIKPHINVLNLIEVAKGFYEKPGKDPREVNYIVLELCAGGCLFDFVASSGRFKEPLARYYFKEFIAGLMHVHDNGITHRDLKPENLMLDENYNLKVADFGFAAPVLGRDGVSGTLHTYLGTSNYMAPEIHQRLPYQGPSVDLFAASIILFIMVAQHPPFNRAMPNDPFYNCLAKN